NSARARCAASDASGGGFESTIAFPRILRRKTHTAITRWARPELPGGGIFEWIGQEPATFKFHAGWDVTSSARGTVGQACAIKQVGSSPHNSAASSLRLEALL